MLSVVIPKSELYDEATNTFIAVNEQKLNLEHSLVSISKWEAKWKKPFISRSLKSVEETTDYIRCMTINKNVDPNVYKCIPSTILKEIEAYIDDPMTASWINKRGKRGSQRIITSELVYCWMFMYRIPIECEKWHFNRLIMLIQICDEENKEPKKMSTNEILRRNSSINAARKAAWHTKG